MKTSVSLLEEYMVNQDEELIYVASEDIDPTSKRSVFSFELSLYGGVYVARGSGPSKKIAKQETAKNMLLKLAKDRSNVQALLDKNKMGPTRCEDLKQLLEPRDNSSTWRKGPAIKTPASILEEYLVDPANYLYSKIVGKSPSSTISFHCTLDLFDGKYHAEATALTKQEAKQLTAKNMLVQLSREKQRLRTLLELSEDLGDDYISRLLQDKDDTMSDESRKVKITTERSSEGSNEAQSPCQACSNKGETVERKITDNNHLVTDRKRELSAARDRSTYTPSNNEEIPMESKRTEKDSEENSETVLLDKKSSQGVGSSMKTPVTLLQEYLVQLQDSKYLPKYIFSKDKSNPSWFHCKMELCNGKYSAEATGMTKQHTKHKTANNMLIQLSKDRPVVKHLLKMNKFHEQEDDDVMNDIENKDTATSPSDVLEMSNNLEPVMKTPVSLLQEYLIRLNCRLNYVSSDLPTKPSEPKEYQYELTVNLFNKKFYTKASAQSKKLAKHETAKNMLLKISEVSAELREILEQNDYYEKMEKVCSLNKNNIVKNNPIFQLQTYCRYHNFSIPEYTLIEESGKVFTMKCQVEYMIEEGTGTKIQAAKHDSAAKMLIRLQDELKRIEQSEKSPQKEERIEIRFSDVDQEFQEMFDETFGKAESNHSSSADAINKDRSFSVKDSNNACEKSDDSNVQVDEERGYYRTQIRKPAMIESVEIQSDVLRNKSDQSKIISKETSESNSTSTQSTASSSISPISCEISSNLKVSSDADISKVSSKADDDIPKVAIMEVELDNVKIVHGGKTKSADTVKSHLSKYKNSLVSLDLNHIIKQVKVNKGFADDDDKGFFLYLEKASVEDLRCIVDVLKCDKDIIIDVIHFRTSTCDVEEFVTNCKLRANNEPSPLSFKSTASDKNESERKALVSLLKYLSTIKA
uniref:RISC-loading complex subunit tarbp2 n=2 Tax=Cacopsylla melanoneura TaxID=428564 RepID=A0A8D9EGU4_9HEMI